MFIFLIGCNGHGCGADKISLPISSPSDWGSCSITAETYSVRTHLQQRPQLSHIITAYSIEDYLEVILLQVV